MHSNTFQPKWNPWKQLRVSERHRATWQTSHTHWEWWTSPSLSSVCRFACWECMWASASLCCQGVLLNLVVMLSDLFLVLEWLQYRLTAWLPLMIQPCSTKQTCRCQARTPSGAWHCYQALGCLSCSESMHCKCRDPLHSQTSSCATFLPLLVSCTDGLAY